MTTLALELRDAGIRWVDDSGAAGPASPGYALWDGGRVVAGRAAVDRAREKPRFVHHRFWQDLDTEPLGKPFPRGLSTADLAHAHLSEVRGIAPESPSGVILAVSGGFTGQQLGLLLGIARSCDLPVIGLVDAATAATPVATATFGHPGRRILHLDLLLHRVVLTELEMSDPPQAAQEPRATVVRRRIDLADSGGLVALHNAWARRIAELFVHATRYDPLHSAASEQALYSRLPEWLEALRGTELIEATLGSEGRERSVEITRPDLVGAAESLYESLPEMVLSHKRGGEDVTLLLAHGLADLPGLEPRLAELRGVTTVPLPAGAAAAGALLIREQIATAGEAGADPSAGLPFVTRLSFKAPPIVERRLQPEARKTVQPEPRRPTHLVHDGLAYPIGNRPFRIGTALDGEPGLELADKASGISRRHLIVLKRGTEVVAEDHSTYGSFVNGERIEGQATLEAGDRLQLGTPGIELQLVAVIETR